MDTAERGRPDCGCGAKKSSHRHRGCNEQQGEAEVAWKRGASNLKRHQIALWICFPTLIFCPPPCNCCPIYLSGAPPRKAGAQKTRQTANSRITMSTSGGRGGMAARATRKKGEMCSSHARSGGRGRMVRGVDGGEHRCLIHSRSGRQSNRPFTRLGGN